MLLRVPNLAWVACREVGLVDAVMGLRLDPGPTACTVTCSAASAATSGRQHRGCG